ncbi:MAG: GAF domain-containing sensor histidine kinase [Spirochaetes bacterium]|nr:GAF domain-containing sensor histidine kinase [Spirochaetota bacterium]
MSERDAVFYIQGGNNKVLLTDDELKVLDAINQKIAAGNSLVEILEFFFKETQHIMPCDRIGIAFSDDGKRLTLYHVIASYQPLYLDKGYTADLKGSSLEQIFTNKTPRIINDLEEYYKKNPTSQSTHLLLKEGVMSSMTCPLYVEGRIVGVLFRSSRKKNVYGPREIALHQAIAERLSQAVEKAYRIEQLSSAINAYMEMLSFVTHELKSPLTSIMTLGITLKQGYFGQIPEHCKNTIDRIMAQAEYLLAIVNEYLNLARLETGSMPIRKSTVTIATDIIEPALAIVQPQADAKHITIEKHYEDVKLQCDPDAMKIVMHNLLSNAIKYNIDNGIIRITVTREDVCRIVVYNTGPGFPEEQKHKLFKRFSRIETDELLARRGSGIGLFVSWNIVYLHNGKIYAHSVPGQYAEFTVELPLE